MTKKRKKTQLESSEETAGKINKVWIILAEFTEEDIENLERVVNSLKEQNENLKSVGGLLVDLDKADYQTEINELRIKRTNALLVLLKNQLGKQDIEIGKKFIEKQGQKRSIEKMFGI